MSFRPIIAITMGDAAGIGPEIIVKTLSSQEIYQLCCPLVIGDGDVMAEMLKLGDLPIELNRISQIEEARFALGTIDLLDLNNIQLASLKLGEINPESARAAVEYLKRGVALAKRGQIDALTTAPINKQALHRAGLYYNGHTQLLAKLTNTRLYAMMLIGGGLRVVLATTHIPLKRVSSSLTSERIFESIKLAWDNMKYLQIHRPRIGVAGLNPHRGEGGLFGKEEETLIRPAIETARGRGIDVAGPLSPDTVFHQAVEGRFDVVVAMYHDQGLIPVKLLAFDKGVNITLGLPIVRTSPDHGTGFDIAGKGQASPGSLMEAMKLAAQIATTKAQNVCKGR